MNLIELLKETDNITKELSRDDLEAFIHEIARTLPEGGRNRFLNILMSFGDLPKSKDVLNTTMDKEYTTLLDEVKEIKEKLLEIDNGERCLESEYNEEWDDWYNSDDDQILFSDTKNILKDIDSAMELLHRCVDMEVYKEGWELAEVLSLLNISADGDYDDFDGSPLGMKELDSFSLLGHDYEKMVQESLYLAYMGNILEQRADKLFSIIDNFQCNNISIEDILKIGNRILPEFNEFVLLWINYLGFQNGNTVEKLLLDAQSMLQDDDALLENARKYVEQHPVLFEQLLRMKLTSGENNKMFIIGMEALNIIPVSLIIRSKIALLTAEYASRLQSEAASEICWVEAFRSDSSAINFMRIRFLTRDWSKYADEVSVICEETYEKTRVKNKISVYGRYDSRENYLFPNEYFVILFFDKQFDRVFQMGISETKAVGWSSTFMKQGLAFFLLMLYDGAELPIGLKNMNGRASSACGFKMTEFFYGTNQCGFEDDEAMFWKLFYQWKNQVQISDDKKQEWLTEIEHKIALRVKGIMDGNHRNYYGECASYIAALGEVQESTGILNAKNSIMEKFKKEYSRRRAFHQELCAYGMKK